MPSHPGLYDPLSLGSPNLLIAHGTLIAPAVSIVVMSSIQPLGANSLRLNVGGNLDVTTVQDLEVTMTAVIDRHPEEVLVELSRLRSIDSVGVGALLRFYKRLQVSGCSVNLSGLCNQPLALFRSLRLDEQLGTYVQ